VRDKKASSDTPPPPKVLRLSLGTVNVALSRTAGHKVTMSTFLSIITQGILPWVGKVVQVAGDWMPQSQLLPPVPEL
jgi:hypothetical protein